MVIKWYLDAMRVTIDRAGRIVVPKPLRDALGLREDSELEIVADGGGLRLDPVLTSTRTITDGRDGLPRLNRVRDAVVTDDEVRVLRDEMGR